MLFKKLKPVKGCCGCVTDLRAAAAIIAVLGIVTSPAVSWAVVRHAYVIRVSCFITTNDERQDVIDINLNHMLSFGFGANAGLGPSCLSTHGKTTSPPLPLLRSDSADKSAFVFSVRWVGWVVLLADLIFFAFSVNLLVRLFKVNYLKVATKFMWSCAIAILLSFVYGMLFVASCLYIGGSFPVYEFLFSILDVLLWLMWIYFILVIRSFIIQETIADIKPRHNLSMLHYLCIAGALIGLGKILYQYIPWIFGYYFY
ncbi:uncharacterized protein LOC142976815 [Anticarsia gemmatalis]|uniref:uncharacterized protein LOC142976815 n=1 Tax=Anticarsia gemmatalis TaxID=129554 RepID=UPI003F77302D